MSRLQSAMSELLCWLLTSRAKTMTFLDLIRVSRLTLEDVQEAAGVLIAGHMRDPILELLYPRAQRDGKVSWQTRIDRVASTLGSCVMSSKQIFMVAKYVPDNRIVGIISTFPTSLATMVWDEPGSEAMLEGHTLFGAFQHSEISPCLVNTYQWEERQALLECGLTGMFWQDAGLCTLSEFEGKGIGYKLVDTLYGRLARLSGGPRQVFATTNGNSRRVYEDYGFKHSWTIQIDWNRATQLHIQRNAAKESPSKPRFLNEYCLTYDLSNVYRKSAANQLSRPAPPLKLATAAEEGLVTLKQYNRLVRPVSSLADLRVDTRPRARKRGCESLQQKK